MRLRIKKLVLLIGDIVVLYSSLYLALLIRYQMLPNKETWEGHFWLFSGAFVFWILIFYISDLYNLHLAVNNAKFFQLTIKSALIAGLLSIVFFYINPTIALAPKTNLVILILVFIFLFMIWRRIFNWLLNAYLPKRKIAFVGFNQQVDEIISTVNEKPHLGFKISILLNDTNEEIKKLDNIKITNNINELDQLVQKNKIDIIILTTDPHNSKELRTILFKCLPLGVDITSAVNFYENLTGKVPINAINQMWFLENLNEGNKIWFLKIKRLYDVFFAITIFLITFLLWPLIGIIIKLESKGPIFFKQIRSGKNGENFTLIKFRTMKIENNDLSLTKSNDPRITKFGNFLRKTRIDEIPQILNVLSGNMSFVGPRPERPEFIKELRDKIPFYEERMLAKPGLTGWDQISGEYHSPSISDSLKKLQYDLFYIKNRSIYLDFSIILKTIATVLSKTGL